VHAFKLGFGRSTSKHEDAGDLAGEESTLETMEAKLSTKLTELEHREEASARALEEERQELVALTRSRAGGMAVEALGRFPSFLTPKSSTVPERQKANDARRAAIEARKAAIDAEDRAGARRDEALATHEETILAMKRTVEEIRARALQIAEAEQVQAERARAVATVAAPQRVAAVAASPAAKAGPERRRHKRVALQAEVNLSSDSNFYSGFAADLSESGIFIATCNVLDRGTEVDLTFTLPTGQAIAARGVVRWAREYNEATPDVFPGVGIEFCNMEPDQQAAIQSFTAQREPLFWAN